MQRTETEEQQSAAAADEMLKDTETPKMKRRLIASLGISYPVDVCINGTYDVGMAVAFDFMADNHVAMGLMQLLLTTISDGDQPEVLCQAGLKA